MSGAEYDFSRRFAAFQGQPWFAALRDLWCDAVDGCEDRARAHAIEGPLNALAAAWGAALGEWPCDHSALRGGDHSLPGATLSGGVCMPCLATEAEEMAEFELREREWREQEARVASLTPEQRETYWRERARELQFFRAGVVGRTVQ